MTCLSHPYSSAFSAPLSGFTLWWSVWKGSKDKIPQSFSCYGSSEHKHVWTKYSFFLQLHCTSAALHLVCCMQCLQGPHHNPLTQSPTIHQRVLTEPWQCLGSFPVAIRTLFWGASRKAESCGPDFLGDPKLTTTLSFMFNMPAPPRSQDQPCVAAVH